MSARGIFPHRTVRHAHGGALPMLIVGRSERISFTIDDQNMQQLVAEIKNGTMPFILLPYYATNHCLQTRPAAILDVQFPLYKVPDCLA